MRSGKFKSWWEKMNRAPRERRVNNFHKWLSLACRTVALRGNQDQQKVVYTIFNRYDKSKYRKLSRENARTVYRIINNKLDNLPDVRRRDPEVKVVRKTTKKTIVGRGRQKTNRPDTNRTP